MHQALGYRRESLGLEREDERLVGGAVQEPPVRLELMSRRAVAAERREARGQVVSDPLRCDLDRAERIHLREEAAKEVVQTLDPIDQRDPSRPVESHVHDVALGRGDHHALDPRLALERPGVGCHDLHARAREGKVQGARARSVRQEETNHLSAPHREAVVERAVHEEDVAEPAHERVRGRLAAERDRSCCAHQEIVEHQHLFPVRGTVLRPVGRTHQHVSVEAELLLDILTHVWVVPVDPTVGEAHAVCEGTAWGNGRLGEVRHAVKPVIESDAMPVHGGRFGQAVGERHDDLGASRDLDQRPRVLSVEAIHRVGLSVEAAAHPARLEPECVTLGEPHQLSGARERRRSSWQVRRHPGSERHFRWQHGQSGRHGHHGPVQAVRSTVRVTVRMMARAGWLPHRANRELEQIRREEPSAGRLAPQHHTAARLARSRVALRCNQHHELFEIHRAECRAAAPHLAQLDHRVHLGWRDPSDVGGGRRLGHRRCGRQALERHDGDVARPAVRGDRDGERSWGMGELDPPGDSRYSRRGHELDAIEIVAGAERRRRVARALLRDGQPGEDRAEEESSGARPHCGGRMAARTRRAITESGRISDLPSPRRLSGARQYVSR